ncbi:hypothetical protein [Ferrigenium sp. UT5]|uniref:hypothetical protein n=1 Tax=Ferrigenium sp. UT5 TaxID=3242105 RepID=UPI00354B426B
MSLLLDAMKKSGHDKGTGLSLEEPPPASAPQTPAAGSGHAETSRAAGQNLFAAKKKTPPRRRWNLGLVPTTLLICGTIGAGYGYYVWTELNPPRAAGGVAHAASAAACHADCCATPAQGCCHPAGADARTCTGCPASGGGCPGPGGARRGDRCSARAAHQIGQPAARAASGDSQRNQNR